MKKVLYLLALAPLLLMCYSLPLMAQRGVPPGQDTTTSADSVALAVQLRHYYDVANAYQYQAALKELQGIFHPYEVVYVPTYRCFVALIGKTTIMQMEPMYRNLKERFPRCTARRITIAEVLPHLE